MRRRKRGGDICKNGHRMTKSNTHVYFLLDTRISPRTGRAYNRVREFRACRKCNIARCKASHEARKRAGMCLDCTSPAIKGKTRCRKCLISHSEQTKRSYNTLERRLARAAYMKRYHLKHKIWNGTATDEQVREYLDSLDSGTIPVVQLELEDSNGKQRTYRYA